MVEYSDLASELSPTSFEKLVTSDVVAWSIVCQCLSIGLVGQLVWGQEFFPRAGAMVTLFALYLVWIALKNEKKLEQLKLLVEQDRELLDGGLRGAARENHWRRLFGGGVTFRTDDFERLEKAAPEIMEQLSKVADTNMGRQFRIAALGTIIWAFGDFVPGEVIC